MAPDKPTAAQMAVDIGYHFGDSISAKRALYAEHELRWARVLLERCLDHVTSRGLTENVVEFLEKTK